MKTNIIAVKLHITHEMESDTALIAASMRLRKASRNVLKLKQQQAEAERTLTLASRIGKPTSVFTDLIADIREQVRLAEEEELAAEQVWEEAEDEALS